MPTLKLRDRDAILTNEKLVFRVLGYSHPPNAYVCDLEYAPEEHFKSNEPRALRKKDQHVFYKFYEDEGWRFLSRHFPEYMIFHEMLRRKMIGVNHNDIKQVFATEFDAVSNCGGLTAAEAVKKMQPQIQAILDKAAKS